MGDAVRRGGVGARRRCDRKELGVFQRSLEGVFVRAPRGARCPQVQALYFTKGPWITGCKCEADLLFVRKTATNTYRDADAVSLSLRDAGIGLGKRRHR